MPSGLDVACGAKSYLMYVVQKKKTKMHFCIYESLLVIVGVGLYILKLNNGSFATKTKLKH
jgi:hypothetical protein